jgi:diguanylate cyclase (GGDEF)-like protein
VAIVGGVLAILNAVMDRQVDSTAHEVSTRSTAVLSYAIENYEKRLATETALLADRPGTKNIYQTDRRTISDHLNELTSRVDADWMVMTDSQGTVIGASQGAELRLDTLSPVFKRVVSNNSERPWNGMIAFPSGATLAASQPIVFGDYIQAVLIAGVVVDDGFLQQISRASTSEVAMVGPQGVIASTIDVGDKLHLDSKDPDFEIASVRYRGVAEKVPGVTYGGPLQLLTLVPETVITGPFAPTRQAVFILLWIGLLLAIAAGAWLAYDLTRPLDALFRAAKTIKEGKWPESFGGHRRDEIGSLQGMFDEMATSLRSSHEKLVGMLEIDPLTELSNYRSFREKFDHLLTEWQEDGGTLGLLLIDVDRLEEYNRQRGTAAGDEVLVAVSKIVAEEVGPAGLCGRYGGSSFGAVLPNCPTIDQLSETIRGRVEAETNVTVSIGICIGDETLRRSDLMFLGSELATSQAKAGGRNRIREFSGFEFSGEETDLRLFLQQGSYSAARALAEAVDAKDEYTRGHSTRVAEYARALAQAGGCDQGFVELVYLTGTLHDVGKIGVPDSALKKEGKLTDEEFALIKMHPEIGEKIVSQIPQLKDTLPGIRNHHERWDGRGYPDHLQGEAIPLVARILAVVDAFDAMTSERPYRTGMPVEIALAEIERNSGIQFDAEWAMRFVEMRQNPAMAASSSGSA